MHAPISHLVPLPYVTGSTLRGPFVAYLTYKEMLGELSLIFITGLNRDLLAVFNTSLGAIKTEPTTSQRHRVTGNKDKLQWGKFRSDVGRKKMPCQGDQTAQQGPGGRQSLSVEMVTWEWDKQLSKWFRSCLVWVSGLEISRGSFCTPFTLWFCFSPHYCRENWMVRAGLAPTSLSTIGWILL